MSDTPNTDHLEKQRKYGRKRPKVPPFARYRGTSAWRGNRRRVRAYEWFLAKSGPETQPPAN